MATSFPNKPDLPSKLAPHLSGRNQFIDICRGIGILLVVYGHALEVTFINKHTLLDTQFEQWKVIYSFHMPLFFFLAGTTFKKRPFREIFTNSSALILLAILCHLVGAFASNFDLKQTIKATTHLTGFSISVVWFLVALGFIQIAFRAIQTQSKILQISTIAFITLAFYVSQTKNITWAQSQAIAPGIFFFSIGYTMSNNWYQQVSTGINTH
jgi:fucose 4-O-acetylase-like acetyltransferase